MRRKSTFAAKAKVILTYEGKIIAAFPTLIKKSLQCIKCWPHALVYLHMNKPSLLHAIVKIMSYTATSKTYSYVNKRP